MATGVVCSYGSRGGSAVAAQSTFTAVTRHIMWPLCSPFRNGKSAQAGDLSVPGHGEPAAPLPPYQIWKLRVFRSTCSKVTLNTGSFSWPAG